MNSIAAFALLSLILRERLRVPVYTSRAPVRTR